MSEGNMHPVTDYKFDARKRIKVGFEASFYAKFCIQSYLMTRGREAGAFSI